jgi:hypothetical protein
MVLRHDRLVRRAAAVNRITLSLEFIAALGTAPDTAIAERFGVSAASVWNARTERGVPSYRQASKGDRIKRLLAKGGLTDSEIARRVGVTPKAVRKHRHALGTSSPYTDAKQDKRSRIAAYLKLHPHASIRTIATETGVSRSVTGTIVKELRK